MTLWSILHTLQECIDDPLRIHTNAGSCVTKKKGYLGSQPFWLDQNGIANVVSLKSLEAKHRVTYDSAQDGGAFVVHTKGGRIYFRRCPETGFPYIDLDEEQGAMLVQSEQRPAREPILDSGATSDTLSEEDMAKLTKIPTIRGNYEGFTEREIKKAREAHELHAKLGQLSATD
jgi:hypothetical protein